MTPQAPGRETGGGSKVRLKTLVEEEQLPISVFFLLSLTRLPPPTTQILSTGPFPSMRLLPSS